MTFFRGYTCFYQLQGKGVLAFIYVLVACWLPLGAEAQDTLRLGSFPGEIVLNTHYSIFPTVKTAQLNYPYFSGSGYSPHRAAINARYLPSLNPQLIWKHTYPKTREQMEERDRRIREENDISRQVIDDVFHSVLSRKKLKAVKPTL